MANAYGKDSTKRLTYVNPQTVSYPKLYKALEADLSKIEEDKTTQVTAQNIIIPGLVNKAIGQPIVMVEDDRIFLDYNQSKPPKIKGNVAALAANMDILELAKGETVTTTTATLNSHDYLVDIATGHEVAYSIGGNTINTQPTKHSSLLTITHLFSYTPFN